MSIDTSGLQEWPDPIHLCESATSLMRDSDSFSLAVGEAQNIWRELSSCYQSPAQDQFYGALSPALDAAQRVIDCSATIGASIVLFSDELTKLLADKQSLEREIKDHEDRVAASQYEPSEGWQSSLEEKQFMREREAELQGKVDDLVRRYEEAIDTCYEQLATIGDDGSPDVGSASWAVQSPEALLAAYAALGQGAGFDMTRTTIRVFLWDGKDYQELRPRFEYNRSFRFDWQDMAEAHGVPASLLDSFNQAVMRDSPGQPSNSTYWPSSPTIPPDVDKESLPTRVTIPGQPEPMRSQRIRLGGPLGLVTFIPEVINLGGEEFAQSQRAFREEHPEMSAGQQLWGAGVSAAVRTGAQIIFTEIYEAPYVLAGRDAGEAAGAAVGTAIFPGLGTAVGAAVGAVGGAVAGGMVGAHYSGQLMDSDTGENKDFGDRVADAAEDALAGLFGP